MDEQMQTKFLANRMAELRKKNQKSQADMAELCKGVNKSTISRAESGSLSYSKTKDHAKEYCRALHLTPEQTQQFMRASQVVVVDTSALMKNPQLINELCSEYSRVVVPNVVIGELEHLKDYAPRPLCTKAHYILGSCKNKENITQMDCSTPPAEHPDESPNTRNDRIVVQVAKEASERYNCVVDLINYDKGFNVRLTDEDSMGKVVCLSLETYTITKQGLTDMALLEALDEYYADSYEDVESKLGRLPTENEINAYLANGSTLIISAVRSKKPLKQRMAKILWLISKGADVNRRDNIKYHFPALTHTIQTKQFELFKFLLHECSADPNVGSRNPYDEGKIRQSNGGNMPLMVAAWHNRPEFVKELLSDSRTSINQQDGNGFTALIKASMKGHQNIRNLLIEAGADQKIVDRDGYTAAERYDEFLETKYEETLNPDCHRNKRHSKRSSNYGGETHD